MTRGILKYKIPMESIRWLALALLTLFVGYTVHASRTESFWKSLKQVLALRWGRQVTMDLYLGLFLFNFFVYLNEGSVLVTAAWLVPTLVLGNIVPLIYFVVNFHSLVGHFI
ncbi:hypothetical protein ACN469_11885 [Corallococcus terminator]